jgi:type II secretory pathway pseudopilin PulG
VVELLVVVALVVLVVSLVIPAAKSVRNRAAQAVEVSAARQLLVAWTGYATDHAGAILPGYRNGLPAFDENGQSIATQTIGVAAARYPWRIAPYLGHDFRGLYLDANLRTLEELAATDRSNYLYQTSVFPSLGLNTTFVGGDENDGCFSPAYLNVYGKFFVDRLSRVRHPERRPGRPAERGPHGVRVRGRPRRGPHAGRAARHAVLGRPGGCGGLGARAAVSKRSVWTARGFGNAPRSIASVRRGEVPARLLPVGTCRLRPFGSGKPYPRRRGDRRSSRSTQWVSRRAAKP